MNLWQRFQYLFSGKASRAMIAVSEIRAGQVQSSPANYESFAKKGYQMNPYVFRSISVLARACAGIEWELYNKRLGGKPTEIQDNPLLTLIKYPNPLQCRAEFIEAMIAYLMIAGNSFMEKVGPDNGPPMELWTLRPDRMAIIPGKTGYVARYRFKEGQVERFWEVDPVTLSSPVSQMKLFHPTDYYYGMSPLEAALSSMDQNNHASRWNLGLLQNSATPSGVLQVVKTDSNPNASLTNEQYAKLKSEFYENYTGSRNSGKPMILEGGLDWKQISLTQKDMEFLNNKKLTAQEIAMVYGVPPMMLGLGDMTYANYEEARLSFYEETVLPIMDFLRDHLNKNLSPLFGDSLYLDYDRDDIEALAIKKEKRRTSLVSANWLTVNEKRTADGYDIIDGWDVLLIGSTPMATPSDGTPPTDPQAQPQDKKPTPDNGDAANQETPGNESDDAKGFKAINLINADEKRNNNRYQNNRRKKLIAPFSSDMREDLKEMYTAMAEKAKGIDASLIEYAMLNEMEKHMPTVKQTLTRHIKRAVIDFGTMILEQAKSEFKLETKANLKFDSFIEEWVKQRTGKAITDIEGTTKKQVIAKVRKLVAQAIEDGDTNYDLSKEMQDEFSSLSKSRAMTIARTEVTMASTQGGIEAIKSLGIPNMEKEWVSVQDTRTRDGEPNAQEPDHLGMNGTRIGIDDKFHVPPDADMDGPGDQTAGAAQVCNCRCTLVYKRGKD